jgi:hypothetical protein
MKVYEEVHATARASRCMDASYGREIDRERVNNRQCSVRIREDPKY